MEVFSIEEMDQRPPLLIFAFTPGGGTCFAADYFPFNIYFVSLIQLAVNSKQLIVNS